MTHLDIATLRTTLASWRDKQPVSLHPFIRNIDENLKRYPKASTDAEREALRAALARNVKTLVRERAVIKTAHHSENAVISPL